MPFCEGDDDGGGGKDLLQQGKDAVLGSVTGGIKVDCNSAVGYLGVYR